VSWIEFRNAFRAHQIPADVMRKKRQEFMDVELFNHLAQYAPNQVDTDDKKNDRFMIGLSTKLQECMALNMGCSFLQFVSNVVIADDAICTNKEAKKRKVVAALSDSAPSRYRTVYHHGPTYLPHHQQQHQHQQAASRALPPPSPVPRLLAPPTAGTISSHTCFNYGRSGHFA
jgi:hypothetical protein